MHTIHKILIQTLGWMMVCLFLSGCGAGQKAQMPVVTPEENTMIETAPQPHFEPNRPAEGSLWNSSRASMFEDTKANYVGDTVIVDIVENSSSRMDVNTESSRETSVAVGVPTVNVLGYETNLGGGGAANLFSSNFNNSHEGEAESDRTGQVTASIAARVVEVLPNGNLSLFGRRAMKVDNEVQYIVVSGVIRPGDISATNRVQSTYLADARIEYYGKGALSDKQKPGWGTRLIDNVWPW